jgi:hypothetical protein
MQLPFDHKQTFSSAQATIPLPKDRREALRLWLIVNKVTFVELGKVLGVTPAAVSQSVSFDRMPVRHHKALVDHGIPPELLPRPEDIPTGPRPKERLAAGV